MTRSAHARPSVPSCTTQYPSHCSSYTRSGDAQPVRRSSLAYLYGCAAADSQPHSAASTALDGAAALRRFAAGVCGHHLEYASTAGS